MVIAPYDDILVLHIEFCKFILRIVVCKIVDSRLSLTASSEWLRHLWRLRSADCINVTGCKPHKSSKKHRRWRSIRRS
jgi:hypothetical protein